MPMGGISIAWKTLRIRPENRARIHGECATCQPRESLSAQMSSKVIQRALIRSM